MLENLRPQFLKKITTILETMFFLIVEPIEEPIHGGEMEKGAEVQDSDASFVKGTIGLQGKKTGTIRIYLPQALAQKMAEDFLGLEEDVIAQNQVLDMIGELINVIAGNLISCIGGQGEFTLTMPRAETSPTPPAGNKTAGEEMDLYFQAEEGWGKLEIRLGEG